MSRGVVGALAVAGAAAVAWLFWYVATTAGAGGDPPVVRLDPSRPRPQGGFLRAAYPEPADLNPFTTVDAVTRRAVLRYTHDALMEVDPGEGSLRPALAEAMEVLEDGRRLRFRLRTGAVFADGTPLTMADVLFTFDATRAEGLAAGALGSVVDLCRSVRALDERTLEVELTEPVFTAASSFATGYTVMQRAYFVERAGSPGRPGFGVRLAAVDRPGPGTGPYRLERYRPGVDLRLVQNGHSWRRAVAPESWNLAGFTWKFVQDPAVQFSMLRRGELDLYQHPTLDALLAEHPELLRTHERHVYDHLGLGHFAIVWNVRRPRLADRRVRQALTMCFDRERIVQEIYGGHARVSRSWFRPGSPEDAAAGDPLPFDPSRARRLLADAGVEAPEVELLYAAGQPQQRAMVRLGMAGCEAAGIALQARPMEWTTMVARLRAGEFDGMLLHISLGVEVDPYVDFHSSQIDGGRNWMGYAQPEVDALLAAARRTPHAERRRELYRQFSAILRADQPRTLLAYPLGAVLVSRRFAGVRMGRLGAYPERWWRR